MRVLARLHPILTSIACPKNLFGNIKDLFDVDNFTVLKKAIDMYTSTESNQMKSGLKVNLQFLLIKAAKIFKATAITESNMKETEIFDRFLCVFNISKVSNNL